MKQLLFPLLYTLLLPSLVLQSGCNPDDYGPCDAASYERTDNAYVSYSLVQPDTREQVNLLDVLNYPCDRDRIGVFFEDDTPVTVFELSPSGTIEFRATYDDQIHELARSQEVSRRFKLYINYVEIHWIEIRYKIRSVKCSYDIFDYIEVYYDDEFYHRSEDFLNVPPVLIEKNTLEYNRCS